MSTAEVSNSPIPLARSILVKLLAMTFMCVILVVGVTEILASRTSKLIATRAVSIQVEQVVAMIADGSAAAIRFGDGEGLTKTLEAAIASSDGQILGGVFVNAAGDLLASAGDADEGLVEIARDAVTATLHGDAERSLQHGHAVVNPKTGESVGAIALKADAERLMTVAAEASREALVFGLLLLVAVLVPLYFILRAGIARPLARQAAAMAKISAGIYDFKVPDGSRRDEIGSLSQSLEIFRAYMKSTTEAAQTNLFRSAAFSQTKSAMMMVDRDRNIIEQNQACLALFMEHEPEFKKHWPDFDPEVLAGKSIDCFHSQPEHQAAILSDLGRMPYTADISVGDLKVNLQVSAILDAEGKHAGNILEWRDVGEERLHGGIVESIGQHRCYVVYNPDGKMLHANYKARDCLGLSEDEARERHFCDTFQDKAEGESILAAIRAGGSEAGKFQRRRIDNREVWTDSSVNLVIDANGDAYRIVEIANDVTEQEAARRHAESDRNRMVENQEEVVTALKKGLGALADGDLTHDIAQAFADEYEQLRADFNSATAKLRETLGQMVQVAANVKAGSEEISQASEDLSRRTEAQAATLANTATAIDELTASVRSSATGAQEADKAAEGAKHSAKSGGSVVLEAVAAMKEIEESSERIGKIIGVIEDIAFQTNLLALNAGVEAARAGDAGRGFAVVASEVRALAQRSSEAAREIKALISASSDHVAQGVALVDRTGDALEGIVGSVGNIAVQVSEIATSSQQQASGLGEINEGMMRLDSVTQQNAAMVEESTAASRTMRREAEALASLIGFFQTGSEVEDQPRSMTGKQAEASRRIPRRETVEPDSFKIAVGAEDMDIPTSSPRGSTLSDWQDF